MFLFFIVLWVGFTIIGFLLGGGIQDKQLRHDYTLVPKQYLVDNGYATYMRDNEITIKSEYMKYYGFELVKDDEVKK